jgi:CRP-like cAMP-binding protein
MSARKELLRDVDFLHALSAEELDKISAVSFEAKFDAGDVVLEEDKPCDSIYIVVSGKVKVVKEDELIISLAEGATLGEFSFLDLGLPSASVITEDDTLLVRIPHTELEKIMATDSNIAVKIYKGFAVMLSGKLRETNKLLVSKEEKLFCV